MNLPPPFLKHR